MRKKILFILCLVLSLSFNISKVDASGELVYDVTDLTISDTSVVFKGWGLINDFNNHGGSSTIIKVYALKDGDGNRSNWVEGKLSYNNMYDHPLYEANCIRYSGVGKPCVESYENASCKGGSTSCRYDNVGFTASFSLTDLFKKYGSDVDISFKIEISNSTGGTKITDLGVYAINSNLGNGEIYNGKDYSVTISNLSDYGKISVTYGRVLANSQGTFAHGSKFYWNQGSSYRIFDKKMSNSPTVSGLRVYGLYYGTPGGQACHDGSIINGQAPSGNCPGWAYATWVQVDGKVIISLKKDEEEKQCDNNENLNLNCSDGNFDSSCDERVNAGTVYAEGEGGCPGGSASVTATVNIKQTGVLSFSLNRGPIYSGGGFTFSSTYENEASWNYTSGGYRGCPNVTIEYKTKCTKIEDGEITYEDCCKNKQVKSPDCETDSDYENFINRAMAKKYIGLNNSSAVVSMPDSNNVNGPINDDTGTWDCTNDNVGSSWEPNTTLYGSCKFTLYDAYIDKKTSEVVYGNYGGNGYLSEGQMYFIPLKHPTGLFHVSVSLHNLSSLVNMNWSATYECDVECQQKLYDLEDGGYLYYFRPISLADPFPNGRDIGINWVDWINDADNRERLLETYTSDNNLEYTVILSNNDISNIKRYNSNLIYGGGRGYLNYSIDVNGNSDFIKAYNYFTLGNVNHSGLGVFDPEDDMQ